MIQNFLSSWDLFHLSYLAGWLISFLLSMIGVPGKIAECAFAPDVKPAFIRVAR